MICYFLSRTEVHYVSQTLKILKPITDENVDINVKMGQFDKFQCHAGFVQQVLTNVIKNALESLREANTENPTINITSYREGDNIYIKIRDNGPGISKDNQARVFDPFFTTKRIGEGTGLGLSVTYNLIKKLNGRITVESKENEYCEFVVSLPYNE